MSMSMDYADEPWAMSAIIFIFVFFVYFLASFQAQFKQVEGVGLAEEAVFHPLWKLVPVSSGNLRAIH